jgi:hypothetical protein
MVDSLMSVGRVRTGVVLILAGIATVGQAVEIEISAGNVSYPAGTTPISCLVNQGLDTTRRAVVLMSEKGDRVVAQRGWTSMSLLHWMLEAPLAAHETRRYEITQEVVDDDEVQFVKCHAKDDDFEFTVDGKPALLYNAGTKSCPMKGFKACKRSGFIHPLYAPDGAVVSDDFPPEHPHQHGIMMAWVDSEFQGETVDFWNSMKNQGIVEHAETIGSVNGPVYGELSVRLRHSQVLPSGVKQPVLDELWFVRVYRSKGPRMFEILSTMTCATDKPLHLRKYHYGGMAFRGAREWSFGKAEFLTSERLDRKQGNHTRPRWTAISGSVGGKTYTVCGIDATTNFRHPQPVRLHEDMPYFCWSPPVLGKFDITPEKPYASRYRFFVTKGSPDAEQFDTLQTTMATPLMAKVVE